MARGSHKINPELYRLGINKNWKSRWYVDKKDYANVFLVDTKIRNFVENTLKTSGVGSIIIKRTVKKIIVEISVARPGVVIGRGGTAILDLKKKLENIAKQEVEPKIYEIKNPEIVASLIAQNIAMQCERRVPPRVAAERARKAAIDSGLIKGFIVWIGGRIKGGEMARVEKVSWGEGNVPRHTLRSDIDFAFAEAQVPLAGKHGIKVWVNKGEKNTYSID